MTVTMEEHEHETVSSTASGWLVLLESGEATAEDRRRFADWLAADPAHPVAYREAERFWVGLDGLNGQDVRDLDRYLEDDTSASPIVRRTYRRQLTAMAATVLLVTAIGLWVTTVWHPRGDYHTATGEQQTVTLADGSTVQLNTETALSVALNKETRRLMLHRGEAFFTVAPDTSRPFEVSAGGGTIRALGTAFNVRTDSDRVTVTVTEHSIRIMTHGQPTAEVHSGERISYSADGRIGQIERADVTRALAWQRHRLIFENQPLADVLEELARYRSGWILLRDPSLRTLSVTGVFDTAQPNHILLAIEESLPIRTVKLTDQLILLHRDHTKKR
jgi:transmembrane sensor